MGAGALGGLLAAVVVATASLWVLQDARARARLGRPVVATFGALTVERPEVWATLCLLVVIVFLPLYLTARRAD